MRIRWPWRLAILLYDTTSGLESNEEAVDVRGKMAEMKMEAIGWFWCISSAKVMVEEATAVETDGLRLFTG